MPNWWQRIKAAFRSDPPTSYVGPVAHPKGVSQRTIELARQTEPKSYFYPIQPPELMRGVVPPDVKPAIAMDYLPGGSECSPYVYAQNYAGVYSGFPGYPYLAMLSTRAEYRAVTTALSTELTREWITLNSSAVDDDSTKAKITELTKAIKDLGLKDVVQLAAEHDGYFGRAQIFIGIDNQDKATPLIISPKTIKKGAKITIKCVEPIWTSPLDYNASDPSRPDFYKPNLWYMLGQKVHSSRLITVITRPVPDILKPAFNFSGISMSQLIESYVDNWLKTKTSVSNLISNFSITALSTAMEQALDGVDGAGQSLIDRITLFVANRDNQGLMVLDKDREELTQLNTPLGTLDALQAQAEEHIGFPARMPMIVLTGISPKGLNASSEGELRVWENWVMAQNEAFWRSLIETIIHISQLSLYGTIDPDITFTFNPLYQMTPKELSEIRLSDAQSSQAYVTMGAVDGQEVRERIARDPESGYQGLDLGKEITPLQEEDDNDEADTSDSDTSTGGKK